MQNPNGRRETHQVQADVAKQGGILVNPRVPPLPQLFSAVLLAGGKSTRMGMDKARVVVGDELLWERQWSKLAEIGATERFISGARDGPWRAAGIEVVTDRVADAGPLAGIAASLQRARFPWLLVLAVDLPNVPSELLRELVRQAMDTGRGQVPQRGAWLQPLAAVYPKSSLSVAEKSLAGSDRSMRSFFLQANQRGIVAGHPISEGTLGFFRNLNTPEDLIPSGSNQPRGSS